VRTIGVRNHGCRRSRKEQSAVITSSQRPRMCSPYVSITARTSAYFEGKK